MQFVLAMETLEAVRKRIEAEGIRDFQATVSKGIDGNLLRWKGIDATLRTARFEIGGEGHGHAGQGCPGDGREFRDRPRSRP